MNSSGKLLKIFFFILSIVAVVESIYLFISFSFNNSTIKKESESVAISPFKSTTLNESQAVNANTVDNLYVYNKSILTSSIINNRFEGEIVLVNKNGGILENEHLKYNLEIKIKGSQEEFNSFYYNEDEVKRIKMIKFNGDQKTPSEIKELKIGDQIVIEESLNLLKDPNNNLEEIDITIL